VSPLCLYASLSTSPPKVSEVPPRLHGAKDPLRVLPLCESWLRSSDRLQLSEGIRLRLPIKARRTWSAERALR